MTRTVDVRPALEGRLPAAASAKDGCCADWPKPCTYHEGFADGIDWLAEVVAGWLREAGYPLDLSFEQPPPPVLRSFVETVWMDRDRVAEPDERTSYRQCVAEEGGWSDDCGRNDGPQERRP